MGLTLTAIGMKWAGIWVVLLIFGLIGGPAPGQAVVMALATAVLSWTADRLIPFRMQGTTRWAIDSGLASLSLYFTQFLWPGQFMTFTQAVFAGFLVGSAEIPLHMYLAARFGIKRRPDDEWRGVR